MTDPVSGFTGRRYRALLGGAVACAALFPAVVFAQDDAEEMIYATPAMDDTIPEGTGNEIIVTATKREVTLQAVPVAVSVTSAEVIQRAQLRDLQDIQMVVPSLRVVQMQSSANTNFFIRGFGNGSNNVGIEPSVGVFIDGVYRSRTVAQISDFTDISRIEVLRGPQSTLFGKNASAGVISIVTQEPKFTFGGSAEGSYGNFNARILKGHVTGPLSDNVAASLAGGINKRKGFIRDLGSDTRTNERDRWFMRGQLLFRPNSEWKIRLIGDYDKIDENCCGVVSVQHSAATSIITHPLLGGQVNAPQDRFKDRVYYNFPSSNKFENYGFSGQADYTVGPFTLSSITAFRQTDAVTDQDSDFTSAHLINRNWQDQKLKTFTQEFRASFNVLDKINALLGVFYINEKYRQANEIYLGSDFRNYADLSILGATGGALDVGTLEGTFGALEAAAAGNPALAGRYMGRFFTDGSGLDERYRLKNNAISIFGQVEAEIMDRLTLTLGGNYTRDRKRFSTNVTSSDVFAGVDVDDLRYAPFRQQLLLGGALQQAGINPNDPAAVAAFASNPATAAAFAAMQNFATANQNNPLANPLGALRSLQLFPPFVNVPNSAETGKTRDSDFAYTIRLAYELSRELNVYASYGTGFKASSVNLSRDSRPPASTGLSGANLRYGSRYAGPEDSRVIEFGAKGNWGRYTTNIALFHQYIKGFQSNIFTGTGFALENAGKHSTYGIEFEGTARPIDQLNLGVAMVYLDSKYNSFTESALGDQTGFRPREIPKFAATLSAEWNQPVGSHNLILRSAYHYESRAWTVEGLPGFVERDPAGNLVDASPGFDAARPYQRQVDELDASITLAMNNGMELSVWGRNLLDDRYLNRIFDSVAQPYAISGYPNTPRTYGVAARYRW